MMNREDSCWYAVSLEDLDEEKTCKVLKDWGFDASVIHREHFYKLAGSTSVIEKPLFPMVVLVVSGLGKEEFEKKLSLLEKHGYHIVCCEKLTDEEKEKIIRLTDESCLVKASAGYISGSDVFVTEGPLMGLEEDIKYINRHSRMAKLQMQFLGETIRVKVPLVITGKD